ncbi:MAG: ParB N-terminal domain-containing protein [Thermoplasmatota archaeon]
MTAQGEGIEAVLELVEVGSLLPHEEVVESRVELLVTTIERDGVVRVPVVADAKTHVILDGHHRYEALRRLGARRVPVALVDYRDTRIHVESWRTNETPPTKDQVIAHAKARKLYAPKTTRHPLLNAFREWPVSLDQLREPRNPA